LNTLIALIIVFASGLIGGWLMEFFFRSFEDKKLEEPLFANLQMYGFTAVFSYLLYVWDPEPVFLVPLLFLFTTGIEFSTGYLYLKLKKVRLWNYSKYAYSYKGVICLRFSLYWLAIILAYYYFILPFIVGCII
jgi:uncharacterized membrane protein